MFLRREGWGAGGCGGGGESRFFISHIKPHKPVSPSTVLWLVQVLAMAGIDMEGFHAVHSLLSSEVLLAEVTGVSLTDIIKQGHWSQTSTFQKFYRKNAKECDSNFQSGILNKQL